jgi:hypothetical protein
LHMLLVASKSIGIAQYFVLFCIASQNCQTSCPFILLVVVMHLIASKCEYFYMESGPKGEWKCRKCGNVKAKNRGWTDLFGDVVHGSIPRSEAKSEESTNVSATSQFNM